MLIKMDLIIKSYGNGIFSAKWVGSEEKEVEERLISTQFNVEEIAYSKNKMEAYFMTETGFPIGIWEFRNIEDEEFEHAFKVIKQFGSESLNSRMIKLQRDREMISKKLSSFT